jgi:hypothetical protein
MKNWLLFVGLSSLAVGVAEGPGFGIVALLLMVLSSHLLALRVAHVAAAKIAQLVEADIRHLKKLAQEVRELEKQIKDVQ